MVERVVPNALFHPPVYHREYVPFDGIGAAIHEKGDVTDQ